MRIHPEVLRRKGDANMGKTGYMPDEMSNNGDNA
jgi:hypothetical protein